MLHPFFNFLSFFLKPTYIYLPIGFIFLCMGVEATISGKTRTRFGGVNYRAKEPKAFWWDVSACYLGGIYFIGHVLYLVYGQAF